VGGEQVAWAWVSHNSEVGDPGRYTGFIYGEVAQTTTLREFKDAVETVRAAIVDAVRGLR
jgi:hypothetical protein